LDAEQHANSELEKRPTGRPCLLVIFRAELTLSKDIQWPLKGFAVGDRQYNEVNIGGWTGFYDWLRDSEENLLGVRYSPFKDCEFLIERTAKLQYVKPDFPRNIEIYFSERREVEAGFSCDQDFLYDAIFRSDDGEYAIGFGMEELTEANLRSLGVVAAEWVVARPLK
jgi:hypothetical protein